MNESEKDRKDVPSTELEPYKIINNSATKRKRLTKDEILQQEIENVSFERRKAGASYEQIAKALSKDYARLFYAFQVKIFVERAIDRVMPQEDPEVSRRLQAAQIDQLILSLWPSANAGDITAAKQIERFMDRKAKLQDLDAVKGTQNSLTVNHNLQQDAAKILDKFKDKEYILAEADEDEDVVDAEIVEEEPKESDGN